MSEQYTKDDMALPDGATCQDCVHFNYCVSLFGCKPSNTTCDWSPSRFAATFRRPDELIVRVETPALKRGR